MGALNDGRQELVKALLEDSRQDQTGINNTKKNYNFKIKFSLQ